MSRSIGLNAISKLTICALATVLFLAGCRSSPPPLATEPDVGEKPRQFWLCEPGESDRDWECEKSEEEQESVPRVSKIAIPDPEGGGAEIGLEHFLRALKASTEVAIEGETDTEGGGSPSLATLRNPPYRSLAHFMDSGQTLLDVPPSFFAVEIASSEMQEEIDEFILRTPSLVRSLLQVVAIAHDGTTRYVVLLGVYRDKNRADVAALSYRNDFEDAATEVHVLGEIQAGIRAASEQQASPSEFTEPQE